MGRGKTQAISHRTYCKVGDHLDVVEHLKADEYYVSGKVVELHKTVTKQYLATVCWENLPESRVINKVWWNQNVVGIDDVRGEKELDFKTFDECKRHKV